MRALSLLGAPGSRPQRRPSWNRFLPLEALDSVRLWEPLVCRLAEACPETLPHPGGKHGLSRAQEAMGGVRAPPRPPTLLSTAPFPLDPLLQGSEPHSRPLARVALTAGQGPSSGRGPDWEVGGMPEAPRSPPLRTWAHWVPASYAGYGTEPPAAGLGLACVRSKPAGLSLSPAPPVPDPPLPQFPKGQPGCPQGPPPLHPALQPLPVSAFRLGFT